MKAKPNRLSHEQFYKLTQIMSGELREWLMDKRPSYREAADRCANVLGYSIVDSQVESANKICGNIYEPRQSTVMKKHAGRVSQLEQSIDGAVEKIAKCNARLSSQEAEIAYLRMLVHHLYHELAARPPAGVVIPDRTDRLAVVNSGK